MRLVTGMVTIVATTGRRKRSHHGHELARGNHYALHHGRGEGKGKFSSLATAVRELLLFGSSLFD